MTAYRDDVEALAARHDALASELVHKTREVAAAAQLLEEARARARLPILDNIRIASPCTADWSQMTGDERVRACSACQKSVYNLSEMTRAEAEALIVEKEGKLCARYFQRKDGTILLKDCTVGVSRKRTRRLIAAGAAAALAGSGFAAYELLAIGAPIAAESDDPTMLLGDVSLIEIPEPVPPPQAPPARDETAVLGQMIAE